MSSSGTTGGGGIGFFGLLQVVFIVLKILDKIDWSWWYVLLPTWISLGLFVFVGIPAIALIVYLKEK